VEQKTAFVALLRILNQLFELLKAVCLVVDTWDIILEFLVTLLRVVDLGVFQILNLFLNLDIDIDRTVL
jgi:hypothetical protein